MYWIDGWDWFWMNFMMVFWVVALGVVIYVAVKLATRPPREGNKSREDELRHGRDARASLCRDGPRLP